MVKKEAKSSVKKTMKKSAAEKAPAKKSAKSVVSGKKECGEDLGDLIAKKAYEFYLERGGSHGDDHSDWYRAEQFVKSKCKK